MEVLESRGPHVGEPSNAWSDAGKRKPPSADVVQ